MEKYKVEVQDENGNIYYPHTEADVTFMKDGENVEDKINEILSPGFDDSGTADGITDKTSLLSSLISKMPLVKFMRNVKAGFKLALYAGEIVNNCVTNRPDLPLSAAQGKVLMDMLTVLNTKSARQPDYSKGIDIGLPYTATMDGYIMGGIRGSGSANREVYIFINGNTVGWLYCSTVNFAAPIFVIVRAGDRVTASSGNYDALHLRFVPYAV